jgi:hypothetical protein
MTALAKATVDPVNLGVAAAAGTLAFGFGSIVVGALGGLAYAAMVAYDTIARRGKSREPSPLPDPKKIADPDTRDAIERIVRTHAEIERTLAETPEDVLAHLTTTVASLHEIESYAARLAPRADDLAKYLKSVDVDALVNELKRLKARTDAAADPAAKQSYQAARTARQDEIRMVGELKNAKDRLNANLSRVVALLGALPMKIVHMRVLDAQAMDQITGDMNEELAAVNDELKTSEEVIKQLGEAVR